MLRYGRGKTGTRKHLRKFHGIIPNPPIEVLDDHSDRPLSNIPGFDKPQYNDAPISFLSAPHLVSSFREMGPARPFIADLPSPELAAPL